jgi:hypothetical protein
MSDPFLVLRPIRADSRQSHPPTTHPDAEDGIVWIALTTYRDLDHTILIGSCPLGVFTTRRRALRAIYQYFLDDEAPLAGIHRLTWDVLPHLLQAWDSDRWDDPNSPCFTVYRERIDEMRG